MATVAKALVGLDLISVDLGLYIEGTNLNDTLFGTGGADEIHGRFGNDLLYGGGGNDWLFGEEGNDSLSGGAGDDRLDGGSGNDMLTGGTGADALIGGAGFDTANYASAGTSVGIDLAANAGFFGDALGDTYSSVEKVIGSNFDDWLVGDNTGVVFEGGGGDDVLIGGTGLDVLNGGSGGDRLEGGKGLDVLTGGGGADHFVFNRGDGPDVVMDFQQGVDKIILNSGLNFLPFGHDQELLTGTELPPFHPHHVSGVYRFERLFFDTDDQQLYELNPFSGATLLASFANGVQLQTSDFIF